jgi:uncharacterized repeat protein (TIGR04138 family)
MEEPDYLEKIANLLKDEKRYKFDAYSFVLAALHHTVSRLDKPRHVTGRELLEGIRDYALEQYGPLAKTVLNYWGVCKTVDFGHIVFALVEAGILRKQPQDRIEDFQDIYAFDEAFDKGYRIADEED